MDITVQNHLSAIQLRMIAMFYDFRNNPSVRYICGIAIKMLPLIPREEHGNPWVLWLRAHDPRLQRTGPIPLGFKSGKRIMHE